MALIDETGNKYGKLMVLKRDFSKPNSTKKAYQLCQCDCGNTTIVHGSKLRNGETKSCGCLRKISPKAYAKDITGQRFDKLVVLKREGSTLNGVANQLCQCDCGKQVIVQGSNLRTGHTTSCGCNRNGDKIKDITNQKFGLLTALYRLDEKKNTNYIQHCKCECGNEIDIDINTLTQGKKFSCGCNSKSKGELKIREILKENNISFLEEKSFKTCYSPQTNRLFRFDFFVENKYLIEYDGEQHFDFFKSRGFFTEELLQNIKNNDSIKNDWCIKNNIPLIRIPYQEYENLSLEDLKLETSNFIYKGDN